MTEAMPNGLVAAFQAHYDELLRFLSRRLGTAERAADVAQDTYLRLTTANKGGEEVRDARAFVFRVAGNLAIDERRRDGRRADVQATPEAGAAVPDPAPSAEAGLLQRERLRLLDAALEELPGNVRSALLMSRVDGLTHAAIARRLGVSDSMVAKYIAQALRHCRRRLGAAAEAGRGAAAGPAGRGRL